MAQAKKEKENLELPSGLKLTPQSVEDIKLKELVERFNILMQDFAKEGYLVRPYTYQGIEIVKIEQKKKGISLNPFNKS